MKRLFKSTPGAVIVLGALALVIAAAGGAVAATGGGGGKAKKITVCVSKADGSLYQAKSCGKDKKLTWNKQGPAGPQGAQGARGAEGPRGAEGHEGKAGANGANGANGAVAAFFALKDDSVDITGTKGNYTTILSKQLPAGSFIVQGQANVSGGDSDPSPAAANTTCRLLSGSASSEPVSWVSPPGTAFLFKLASGSLATQMPLTLAGPATVSLQCKSNLTSPPGTFNASVLNATISAIQASSVG